MNTVKSVLKFTLPGVLLFPSSCTQKSERNDFPPKPNIIFIIADDMGWDDCGAYGHPNIRTPNIDMLAKQGMKFTNAYLTTSSCSPTRASLITGLYPHQTDAEQLHWPIPANKITFVEKLREAGYWTAQAGKWHMGDAITDRFDFIARENAAFIEAAIEGKEIVLPDNDGSGCHLWVHTLQYRPEGKPFFLWFAASDPHRPYKENIIPRPHTPAEVVVPPYLPDEIEVRKDLALYYDEIARLDDYIGKVLEELEKQGQADNTLVLFISDNGRPFPRDKTTLYDSGIKTPFILRWPDVVKPGTVSSSLISVVDIAPTFLKLAGIEPPENLAGKDFRAILKSPETEIRDYIFAQAHWHDAERLYRGVRDKRFKYIRNFYPDLPNTPPADALKSMTFAKMLELKEEGKLTYAQMNVFVSPTPEEELYDTEKDPFELNNLAVDLQYAKTLTKMRKVLETFMDETNDHLPASRTPDEFDRHTGDPLPNRKFPRPGKL